MTSEGSSSLSNAMKTTFVLLDLMKGPKFTPTKFGIVRLNEQVIKVQKLAEDQHNSQAKELEALSKTLSSLSKRASIQPSALEGIEAKIKEISQKLNASSKQLEAQKTVVQSQAKMQQPQAAKEALESYSKSHSTTQKVHEPKTAALSPTPIQKKSMQIDQAVKQAGKSYFSKENLDTAYKALKASPNGTYMLRRSDKETYVLRLEIKNSYFEADLGSLTIFPTSDGLGTKVGKKIIKGSDLNDLIKNINKEHNNLLTNPLTIKQKAAETTKLNDVSGFGTPRVVINPQVPEDPTGFGTPKNSF